MERKLQILRPISQAVQILLCCNCIILGVTPCEQQFGVICKHLGVARDGSRQVVDIDQEQYGTQYTALEYTTQKEVPGMNAPSRSPRAGLPRDSPPQHASTFPIACTAVGMWHSIQGLLEVQVNDVNATPFFNALGPHIQNLQ